MTTFQTRRWRNLVFSAALVLLVLFIWWVYQASPQRPSIITGWTLMGLIVALLAYNIRKKLPFLPLSSSATWLQWHLYAGWLSILLFGVHINFAVPTGWFETLLALVFTLVAVSGVIGIWISRVLAKRLTTHGESALYERIGVYRRDIRNRAEDLVVQSVADANATTIADFYAVRLVPFFDQPRNFWSHLIGSIRPRHSLLREIRSLRRYLKDRERELMTQIEELVCVKDDLDYQYAAQSVLKWWLFIHIPLAYSVLILALVHVALVYAFTGGGR